MSSVAEETRRPGLPGRGRSRWQAVAVVVAAIAALTLAVWWVGGRSDVPTDVAVTGDSVIQQIPVEDRERPEPFTARLLSGEDLDSRDLSGEVVVYNVWGSWCGPCYREAPALAEVARETAGRVSFVGINVRDNDEAARSFERRFRVPYDSVTSADSGRAILSFRGLLSATAVPSTLVLDRQGRVAARVAGEVTAPTLRALVENVLAEPSA